MLERTAGFSRVTFINEFEVVIGMWRIPRNQFVVGFGGAMLLHGLRERTQDLDLDVPLAFYKDLRAFRPNRVQTSPLGEYLEYQHHVAFHPKEHTYQTVELIDGIMCYRKSYLLEEKMRLNRLKDQRDIVALRKALGQ